MERSERALTSAANDLKRRIEHEYRAGGYKLGWRLLYSPETVLGQARVAFVGLNPGGDYRPTDHAEFAMAAGSAYEAESWGAAPGQSKLQRQVTALFRKLGQRPENVLAGNLVPFRSPSWDALPNREQALEFGREIWSNILARARPQLVIAMGGEVFPALSNVLRVQNVVQVPVGWGAVSGSRADFPGGILVRLPHLSRFGIVSRNESQTGLSELLHPYYGNGGA